VALRSFTAAASLDFACGLPLRSRPQKAPACCHVALGVAGELRGAAGVPDNVVADGSGLHYLVGVEDSSHQHTDEVSDAGRILAGIVVGAA